MIPLQFIADEMKSRVFTVTIGYWTHNKKRRNKEKTSNSLGKKEDEYR